MLEVIPETERSMERDCAVIIRPNTLKNAIWLRVCGETGSGGGLGGRIRWWEAQGRLKFGTSRDFSDAGVGCFGAGAV